MVFFNFHFFSPSTIFRLCTSHSPSRVVSRLISSYIFTVLPFSLSLISSISLSLTSVSLHLFLKKPRKNFTGNLNGRTHNKQLWIHFRSLTLLPLSLFLANFTVFLFILLCLCAVFIFFFHPYNLLLPSCFFYVFFIFVVLNDRKK